MKRTGFAPLLFLVSLALVGCGSTPGSEVAESDEVSASTDPPASTQAADTATTTSEAPAPSEEPTTTAGTPPNVIRLTDVDLVAFGPPWFAGDLASTVFVEDGHLRIDAPIAPSEPGKNNVMGAVALTSNDSFDISATFDAEGGACKGIDFCGNTDVFNCIVFDFADYDNMQKFCIQASALFWHLVAFENGTVVYDSSVQLSEAIHDASAIYRGKHPLPNEMRLTLQAGILYGYINGTLVFERDGAAIEGKIGVGCINTSLEPAQALSNCDVVVAIGP